MAAFFQPHLPRRISPATYSEDKITICGWSTRYATLRAFGNKPSLASQDRSAKPASLRPQRSLPDLPSRQWHVAHRHATTSNRRMLWSPSLYARSAARADCWCRDAAPERLIRPGIASALVRRSFATPVNAVTYDLCNRGLGSVGDTADPSIKQTRAVTSSASRSVDKHPQCARLSSEEGPSVFIPGVNRARVYLSFGS